MPTLTIRLTRRESARIATLAKKRRVPRSTLVREAIAKLGDSEGENIHDDWSDFIGSVEKAPGDLATHPKHLKSFGRWRKSR